MAESVGELLWSGVAGSPLSALGASDLSIILSGAVPLYNQFILAMQRVEHCVSAWETRCGCV